MVCCAIGSIQEVANFGWKIAYNRYIVAAYFNKLYHSILQVNYTFIVYYKVYNIHYDCRIKKKTFHLMQEKLKTLMLKIHKS